MLHRAVALLALASVLVACGGGGGELGASGSSVTPLPSVPEEPPIMVTAAIAPVYGAADCPRFMDPAAAAAVLDLSDPDLRALDAYLRELDAAHARNVFLRRPYDFVNWIAWAGGKVDLVTLPSATHETMHMDDEVLAQCAPAGTYKALFMGDILVTGLRLGDTPSVKVVDAVIDPALKSFFRYDTYITQAAPDNDFTILLDEFAGYAGAAHTELRMLQAGRYLAAGGDAQMGGSVTMMVYVQYYLKAVRLDYPTAWTAIRNDPATVAAVQAIWSRSEQTLRDEFPYTLPGGVVQMRVDPGYFRAAYSAELLSELDAIGVTHLAPSAWSGTYLP